jgi:hypothetical protein
MSPADGFIATHTTWELDAKLRELASMGFSLSPYVISSWLRDTHHLRGELPSWQPLLSRAIEVCRYSNIDATQCLSGLLPSAPFPPRNTGQPTGNGRPWKQAQQQS